MSTFNGHLTKESTLGISSKGFGNDTNTMSDNSDLSENQDLHLVPLFLLCMLSGSLVGCAIAVNDLNKYGSSTEAVVMAGIAYATLGCITGMWLAAFWHVIVVGSLESEE